MASEVMRSPTSAGPGGLCAAIYGRRRTLVRELVPGLVVGVRALQGHLLMWPCRSAMTWCGCGEGLLSTPRLLHR